MDNDKIDFVLTWVDDSDKAWREQRRKYENRGTEGSCSDAKANDECRYRDYGLLHFWFRAVEKYTPWVNQVFFVTCGQKPAWLNESHPKLRLVNHTDYIPTAHLPTFHSNTIELNLYRIPELSEHFVLFNDDMFILRPLSPDFFFRKGLPVLSCDLGIPRWLGYSNISRIVINNNGILKHSFDVESLIWKHIGKYIDVRALGFARALKNLISFSVNKTVLLGTFGHLPNSHLKSTLGEIWQRWPKVMERTSSSRFRTDDCVNQWLACAWNMVSGRFYPMNEKKRGEFSTLNEECLSHDSDVIRHQLQPQICLNDNGSIENVERCSKEIANAFLTLLPEKSSFEK